MIASKNATYTTQTDTQEEEGTGTQLVKNGVAVCSMNKSHDIRNLNTANTFILIKGNYNKNLRKSFEIKDRSSSSQNIDNKVYIQENNESDEEIKLAPQTDYKNVEKTVKDNRSFFQIIHTYKFLRVLKKKMTGTTTGDPSETNNTALPPNVSDKILESPEKNSDKNIETSLKTFDFSSLVTPSSAKDIVKDDTNNPEHNVPKKLLDQSKSKMPFWAKAIPSKSLENRKLEQLPNPVWEKLRSISAFLAEKISSAANTVGDALLFLWKYLKDNAPRVIAAISLVVLKLIVGIIAGAILLVIAPFFPNFSGECLIGLFKWIFTDNF